MFSTRSIALCLLFLLLDCKPSSSQRDAAIVLNAKLCKQTTPDEPCKCKNRVREMLTTDCCCVGPTITEIPTNLSVSNPYREGEKIHLTSLTLYRTAITKIDGDAVKNYERLEELELKESPDITVFDASVFNNITTMRKVIITDCKSLERIDGVFMLPHRDFRRLTLRNNALTELPYIQMTDAHKFHAEIDLSDNNIQDIPAGRLRDLRVRSLRVVKNQLKRIEADAFSNCSIHELYLSDNTELDYISQDAFRDVRDLNHLVLSKTAITSLPSNGMDKVKVLLLNKVETLKQLPPVIAFTSLKRAEFTYPHHCCLFSHVSKTDLYGTDSREHRKRICKKKIDDDKKDRQPKTAAVRQKRSFDFPDDIWANDEDFVPDPASIPNDEPEQPLDETLCHNCTFEDSELGFFNCSEVEVLDIIIDQFEEFTCSPTPDAMNPCESIVGFPWLRYAIWFFWISSVILNIAVWVILAMAYEHRKRSHYIFMFNLSFANALSAVYLGLLALEDRETMEEYFRFAVGWQTGVWCSAAGFLCVFSSLLSILSMFFISFEIAYSTRQAIFGRHLPFGISMSCVVFSYVFSATMAALPLFGVSDYSKTSTCLPIFIEKHIIDENTEYDDPFDKTYIIFGLSVIITAFIGMVACYGSIFSILVNPNTPSRSEDHHIIMKMLMLILTDMLCWMPSCVLGLTAAFGKPLISISTAKIFIICFFPLNTFTNPFLYVFLTKVIQRKVKKRAVPIFQRLLHTPRHTIHSLSALYHMHGPDDKDRRRKSNDSSKTMTHSPHQDTQTTKSSWLGQNSPRGSAESTALLAGMSWEKLDIPRRSTPRVSFQSDISTDSGHVDEIHPRHFRLFPSILKKVSAIPEVSDLSEHSADSFHEHQYTQIPAVVLQRPTPILHGRAAAYHALAQNSDSGRSSLSSIFARSEQDDSDTPESFIPSSSTLSSITSPLSIDTGDQIPTVSISETTIVIGPSHHITN